MKAGYAIEIAPTGFASLRAIGDKKILRAIDQAIGGLASDPQEQGKALTAPLQEVRSLRAARDRYRILYRVDPRHKVVSILLVGARKAGKDEDVYAVARRLLRVLQGEEE